MARTKFPFLNIHMLTHVDVLLNELREQGKSFKWKRPSCPKCSSKVWGHGFVNRYLNGSGVPYFLKRYRCPRCKTVVTMLPSGFLSRFQWCLATMFNVIVFRLRTGHWGAGRHRQRWGHWLRRFTNKARMDFPGEDVLELIHRLYYAHVSFLV